MSVVGLYIDASLVLTNQLVVLSLSGGLIDIDKFVTLMLKMVKNPCAWPADYAMITTSITTSMKYRNDTFRRKQDETVNYCV